MKEELILHNSKNILAILKQPFPQEQLQMSKLNYNLIQNFVNMKAFRKPYNKGYHELHI